MGLLCNINGSSPPDSVRFRQYLAKSCCPQRPAPKGVGGRPDVTMGHKIDQVAPIWLPKNYLARPILYLEEKLIHAETPSSLDLRSSFLYIVQSFALSDFSVTIVKQYIVFVFCCSAKYIEKHPVDLPSEIQWPPKAKPTSTTRVDPLGVSQ